MYTGGPTFVAGQQNEGQPKLYLIDKKITEKSYLVSLLKENDSHLFLKVNHLTSLVEMETLEGCRGDRLVILLAEEFMDEYPGLLEVLSCDYPVLLLVDSISADKYKRIVKKGAAYYVLRKSYNKEQLKTLLKLAEEQYAQTHSSSGIDTLTGLASRRTFTQRLNNMLLDNHYNKPPALLLIDLDGFKKVNEWLGYQAGDQLICDVAQRLKRLFPIHEHIARIGDNEYGVVIDNIGQTAELVHTVKELLKVLANPFIISGHQLTIGCSIGIALAVDGPRNVDSLIHNATLALKQAKQQLGSSYSFYSHDLNTHAKQRYCLETELRQAIKQKEFQLLYQPRIDTTTGKLCGVEGLLRWFHPLRGLLLPSDFIPLAEETGLIVPLGHWVIYQSCYDLLKLIDVCGEQVSMAINLSFQQFKDARLFTVISHALEKFDVPPQCLEFELTETAMMQDEAAVAAAMSALGKLGITFSLDDFGTGFSSFAHIQQLPISTLKIDRSFICKINSNTDDAVIVQAITNLAHNLNLSVVAEGVENQAQVDVLTKMGCDQLQGFFYSPPVPITTFCERSTDELVGCIV